MSSECPQHGLQSILREFLWKVQDLCVHSFFYAYECSSTILEKTVFFLCTFVTDQVTMYV